MATTNSTMMNATTPPAPTYPTNTTVSPTPTYPTNTTVSPTPSYPASTISNFMLHTSAAFYPLFILPTIFILGLLGNGFTCVSIITRKLYTKSTIFIFIGFISALDFGYILSRSGPELLETFFGVNLLNDHFCRARTLTNKLTNTSSVWILIVCSAVKFYGIAFPLKAMQRDTKRFAVIACISIIVIVPSIFATVAAYCRYLPTVFVIMNNTTTLLYTCTFYSGNPAIYNIMIGAISATYVGIPGVLLFLLSIGILVSFLRSYRQHKRLIQEATTDPNPNESKPKAKPDTFTTARNAVLVLIPMSLIHIVVSLPVFIVIMETASYFATLPLNPVQSAIAFYVTTQTIILNHSLNVYVQVSISKFYRQSLFGIDPGKKLPHMSK